MFEVFLFFQFARRMAFKAENSIFLAEAAAIILNTD